MSQNNQQPKQDETTLPNAASASLPPPPTSQAENNQLHLVSFLPLPNPNEDSNKPRIHSLRRPRRSRRSHKSKLAGTPFANIPKAYRKRPSFKRVQKVGIYGKLFSIKAKPIPIVPEKKKRCCPKKLPRSPERAQDYVTEPYILVEHVIDSNSEDEYVHAHPMYQFRTPDEKWEDIPEDIRYLINRTIDLSFRHEGLGFRFKQVFWPERFVTPELYEVWDYFFYNRYWLMVVSYACFRNFFMGQLIREEVTKRVLAEWDQHKAAVKASYQNRAIMFINYDPSDPSSDVQEDAKSWYEALQHDHMLDFTLFDICMACDIFGISLSVFEVSLECRYFMRRITRHNPEKKGLFIYAREYLDSDSNTLDYFLIKLKPKPTAANLSKYNYLPDCEMYLTHRDDVKQHYHFMQVEYTRLGLLENMKCDERLELLRLKIEELELLDMLDSSSDSEDYADLDNLSVTSSEIDFDADFMLRVVDFEEDCVEVVWYRAKPFLPNRSTCYKWFKRWTGINSKCCKRRSAKHYRSPPHILLGYRTATGKRASVEELDDVDDTPTMLKFGKPERIDLARKAGRSILRKKRRALDGQKRSKEEPPRKASGKFGTTFTECISIYPESYHNNNKKLKKFKKFSITGFLKYLWFSF